MEVFEKLEVLEEVMGIKAIYDEIIQQLNTDDLEEIVDYLINVYDIEV